MISRLLEHDAAPVEEAVEEEAPVEEDVEMEEAAEKVAPPVAESAPAPLLKAPAPLPTATVASPDPPAPAPAAAVVAPEPAATNGHHTRDEPAEEDDRAAKRVKVAEEEKAVAFAVVEDAVVEPVEEEPPEYNFEPEEVEGRPTDMYLDTVSAGALLG